jgi:hypothetical protein
LLTDENIWRFHLSNKSRKGDVEYHICANKKINGCSASAKIALKYEDDQTSEPQRILFDWPKDPMEDHADTCIPEKGTVFADKMVEEMSARVKDDPSAQFLYPGIKKMCIYFGK